MPFKIYVGGIEFILLLVLPLLNFLYTSQPIEYPQSNYLNHLFFSYFQQKSYVIMNLILFGICCVNNSI